MLVYYECRRVVRPWLGLKMLDLNPMIISQLKEKSSTFPDIRKGVLVPMVSLIKYFEIVCYRRDVDILISYITCCALGRNYDSFLTCFSLLK